MSDQILVGTVGNVRGSDRFALDIASEAAGACIRQDQHDGNRDGIGLLVEVGRERPRPASLLAPAAARELESSLNGSTPGLDARARGNLVCVSAKEADGLPEAVCRLREGNSANPLVVLSTPASYRGLLELGWDHLVILSPEGKSDPLTELVMEEAAEFAGRVKLAQPGSGGRKGTGLPGKTGGPFLRTLGASRGQATPLVLGAVFVLVLAAAAIVAVSGAVTGKARAQRAADLSAMSAARSMKDDMPRLLAPPRLPNGLPNPAHMPKPVYLNRARLAAIEAAVVNGASPLAVSVRFPDSASYAPTTARVSISTRVRAGPVNGERPAPPNWAEARVSFPVSMGSVPAMASGGGYSGPLADRQGKGMRPDVAAAFDAMSAAAAAAGVTLAINSAFRSDAEQAALFAANPDPTWVAPPGQSLHRCATELDLGPDAAYSWLAANAGRFGFTQRYSWEPWHYGFVAGPAPCSGAGNSVGLGGPTGSGRGDRSAALSQAVPSITPGWVRPLVLRAAMKWNVSASLLAAQLFAESGFDPDAGNGIAFGIAAFTPAAAAEYGLDDPFDPAAAIMAQAHLMSDLL